MTSLKVLGAAALISLLPFSALAESVELGKLTIDAPWTRATPPKARGAGGYVKITNKGSEDARLVGVASDVAKRTEIHEMKITNDVMEMRKVEGGVVIPAGKTVELKPGSYHIMFMGLKQPFKKGEEVAVTLQFEKAGNAKIELPVMGIGAKSAKHQ